MYNDLIYKDMMKLFKSDSEKKIKKVITKVINRAALRREEVDTEAMFEELGKLDTGESIIRPIVTIEEPEIYYDGETEGFNHPKLKEKEKPFTDENGTKKEAALKYPWLPRGPGIYLEFPKNAPPNIRPNHKYCFRE